MLVRVRALIFFLFFGLGSQGFSVPFAFTYAGRLLDGSGNPLSGSQSVQITFWTAQTGGSQLAANLQSGTTNDTYTVNVVNGVFSQVINLSAANFHTVFPDSTTGTWVQVEAAGITYPRQQFTAVPYALKVPVDGTTITYNSSGQLQVSSIGSIANLNASSTLSTTSSGSASAPAIFVRGDSDTGIYAPRDNSIHISTNGLERFGVNADGNVFVGGTNNFSHVNLSVGKDITGSASISVGVNVNSSVASDVTGQAACFRTAPFTSVGATPLENLYHFRAEQNTFNRPVTNQYGFMASGELVGASVNYGFYSNLATQVGKSNWNFFSGGTAPSYFNGSVGIGTVSPDYRLTLEHSSTNFIRAQRALPATPTDGSGQELQVQLGSGGTSGSGTVLIHRSHNGSEATHRNSIRFTDSSVVMESPGGTDVLYVDTTSSTPRVSVPSGTGSSGTLTPGLSFLGDSDTGLAQPGGGNQVSIVNGGTESLRLNSQGELTVARNPATNAATGQSWLSVAGDNTDYGGTALLFDTRAVAQGVGGALVLTGKYDSSNDQMARYSILSGIKENTVDTDYKGAFTVQVNAGNGPVERLRVASSGNVGIGTPAPAAKLDVAGEVKFGNTSSTCNATNEGQQRYNSTSKSMEFCNGTAWTAYGTTAAQPSHSFLVWAGTQNPAAANTHTKILLNQVEFDTGNSFNTSTNRFQPTKAGYYQINLAGQMSATSGNGGFTIYFTLMKNGAAYEQRSQLIAYLYEFAQSLQISTVVYMNGTTDYLEGYYFTNWGTLNYIANRAVTSMSGYFLHP